MKQSVKFFRMVSFIMLQWLNFAAVYCSGSVLDLPVGARSVSLGGAYTAVTGTPEAIFFNPASLSASDNLQVNFSGTHLFQMKELQYTAVAVNIPYVPGNAGIACKTFGNSMYGENSVSLGWAFSIGRQFHFGLAVKKNQLRIKEYGSEEILLFDLGLLFNVTKTLKIGGAVLHAGKSSDTAYRSSIPLIYSTGLSWKVVKEFLFCFDLTGTDTIGLNTRFGCELRIWQPIWIRFGIERVPSCFSSGLGVQWKNIVLDYAVRYHYCLGATHYCSVSFFLR
ncbi:MAG: hypothetical protein R6V04_17270 [bacterium]